MFSGTMTLLSPFESQPTSDNDGACVQIRLVKGIRQKGYQTGADDVHILERTLERSILDAGVGTYGGHGIAFDTHDIFLYGPDARALAAVVFPIVHAWEPAAESTITVGETCYRIADLAPDHFAHPAASSKKRKTTGRDPAAGNHRAERRRAKHHGDAPRSRTLPEPDIRPLDSAHPLLIALGAAAPLRILQLEHMTDAEFEDAWRRWRDEGLTSEAFASEATLYRSARHGQSAEAFNVLAKVIAVLSFAPGGVEAFGQRWIGRRSSPAWAAMNSDDSTSSSARSLTNAFKALDEIGAPISTIDRNAA